MWHHLKVDNQTSHFLQQIWQCMTTTLSQWLGSFWIEPKAKIWHQWRPNVPLSTPINRWGFYVMREETIRSKVDKKSAYPPFLLSAERFSPLSLSPPPPPATSTLTVGLTIIISTTSSSPTTLRGECTPPLSLSPL